MALLLKALISTVRLIPALLVLMVVMIFTMNYSKFWEKTCSFVSLCRGFLRELFVNRVLRGRELCFWSLILIGCIASVSHWGGVMAVQSTVQVPVNILSALKKASHITGADFNYLVNTAARESGFRPGVKASTSTATGLFQFIDSTWLQMVKDEGPSLGLGAFAKHISKSSSGRYVVENEDKRREILNLRKDPEIAALMAGAFTKFNARSLESDIGRKPTSGELYIAHFLGAGSGAKLINAATISPDSKAAELFPAAARSNKSLFYRKGEPVSVKNLYQNLVRRHHAKQVQVANQPKTPPLPELKPRELEELEFDAAPPPLKGDEIKAAALRATLEMARADERQSDQIVGGLYSHFSDVADAARAVEGAGRPQKRGDVAAVSEDAGSLNGGGIGVWRGVGGAKLAEARALTNLQNGVRPILESGKGASGLFLKGGLGFAKG